MPGSALPGEKLCEKNQSEAVEMWLDSSLFADDATVVGDEEELENGVAVTKKVMGDFEERNNDDKEEPLVFGSDEAGEIRMLGWKQDVERSSERARKAWWKVKRQLKWN